MHRFSVSIMWRDCVSSLLFITRHNFTGDGDAERDAAGGGDVKSLMSSGVRGQSS